MRITQFLRKSSHTNPFRKIPDSKFASIYYFQTVFHQICWAWAIFRRIIKNDIRGRTDGLTDDLIWGGLGNLRFLQVNTETHHTLQPPKNTCTIVLQV